MENFVKKLHDNCLEKDTCGDYDLCENCLATIQEHEKPTDNTFIFEDYETFCIHLAYHPEEKHINGVSKWFVMHYPNYKDMNLSNKGCWNCRNCDNCIDCHFADNLKNCVECWNCDECENCVECENCQNCFDCDNIQSVFYYAHNKKTYTHSA